MNVNAPVLNQLPTDQRLLGLLVLLAIPIGWLEPWLAVVIVITAVLAGGYSAIVSRANLLCAECSGAARASPAAPELVAPNETSRAGAAASG